MTTKTIISIVIAVAIAVLLLVTVFLFRLQAPEPPAPVDEAEGDFEEEYTREELEEFLEEGPFAEPPPPPPPPTSDFLTYEECRFLLNQIMICEDAADEYNLLYGKAQKEGKPLLSYPEYARVTREFVRCEATLKEKQQKYDEECRISVD